MMDSRYARQILFSGIGREGQRRLSAATAVVIGLGSLGSVTAELLARAGVGSLRLVDRDFVEESNLSRQTLYEEEDARQVVPKAIAATRRLQRVNSEVSYQAFVADFSPANAEETVRGAGVVVDGTDNFETRYLINETCVKLGIPWVYGACAGSGGLMFVVRPGQGPCLRCFIPDPPAPGQALTCETSGIIGPAASTIASLETAQALRILAAAQDAAGWGQDPATVRWADVWSGEFTTFEVRRRPDCECCVRGSFPYLEGRVGTQATVLCGRDMVQVTPKIAGQVSLDQVAERLTPLGKVTRTEFLVRVVLGETEMVVFPDGRALIKGTSNPEVARGIYARYLGA
jgi:adenylyltransferase/sulfurtransferase